MLAGASHRPVDVGGLGFEQGLVVFTSTDCTDCTTVMRTVRDQDVYVREVTFELESKLFEAAGVVGVPLLVGVDEHGATVGQLAGVPTERELSRLIIATR